MLKKIFVHSFFYSLSPILLQAGSLIMLPFLTPHLTAIDYGIYGIITSYLLFVSPLRDMGFNVVFVNSYFRYPTRWKHIWKLLYGHLVLWSIAFFLLQAILLYIALPKEHLFNYYRILLLSVIPSVVLDTPNFISNYYFRFSERPKIVALVGIVSGICSLVAVYYCIAVLKLGYMGWFIGSFIQATILFLCYLYPVYIKEKLWPIVSFRKKFIAKQLKVSLPYIPHNYSSYLLNSSDRVMMSMLKTPVAQIGLYNIAYRFGNALDLIGEAIGMAVGPQYVKLYTSGKNEDLHQARRVSFMLMILFMVAAFLLSIWLREIFLLLIKNAELVNSYEVGVIILMGYCYKPMYWSTVNKLTSHDKTGVLWRISFLAGIINIVLNLIFLKEYGIFAAAINTFLSLMFMGFYGFCLRDYKNLPGLKHYPLLWFLLVVVLTILAYLLRDSSLWVKLFVSIGILLTAGCALLAFTRHHSYTFKIA